MPFPGRPHRLRGFPYDEPGPVYHIRFGTEGRASTLRDEAIVTEIIAALRHHHGKTADILAYCVMPDHVHVLLALREPGKSLSRWVGDLKRWLSRRIAVVWQSSFYEHVVRTEEDLRTLAEYIFANPVRAKLAERPSDYPWWGSFEWNYFPKAPSQPDS